MITIIFLFNILISTSPNIKADLDDKLKIYPTADSDIRQRIPDECFGDSPDLYVSTRYGGLFRIKWQANILIKFDFSIIESDMPISSATLHLYYATYFDTNPDGRQLTCYRIENSWNEDTVTWNNRPNKGSAHSAYAKVPSSPKNWVTLDVTTDVQNFVGGTVLNYGWWIMDDDFWLYRDIPQHIYSSRESQFSPYLEITFQDDGTENNPPNVPRNPSPSNNTEEIQSKEVNRLQWDCDDIDGSLRYDVYFEKNNSNPRDCISKNQSNKFIDIGYLDYDTSYFWYVISWNSIHQSSTGPIWSFSTEESLNSPPNKPTIKGPNKGKNYQDFSFTFFCSDPEHDPLTYFIDWGDGNAEKSTHILSDEDFIINHYWVKPGSYTIQVYSIDDVENGSSSASEILKYNINIGKEILDIGYVLDIDDDGIFDTFHNAQLGIENSIKMIKKDLYELDIDNDLIVDHLYSSSTDKLEPIVEKESINMLWFISIVLMIIVFVFSLIILYLKGRKNKQNETIHKDTSIVVNGNSTIQKCCVCLGRMKGGYSVVKCHCGNLFHKSCIERIGKCPNCSRVYTKVENEKE